MNMYRLISKHINNNIKEATQNKTVYYFCIHIQLFPILNFAEKNLSCDSVAADRLGLVATVIDGNRFHRVSL